MSLTLNRLSKYSLFVIAFNLIVIFWGAFVRATGSGAGCGNHWPLCNGEVLPRPEAIETTIEFSHRVTSGIAFLLVVGLLAWVLRSSDLNQQIRRYAWGAMIFMISESLVGAGLVLFDWVAGNISVARVIVMGVHLANTMMLILFLTLIAWSLKKPVQVSWAISSREDWLLNIAFLGV